MQVSEKDIDFILIRAFDTSPYFQMKFLQKMGFQAERFVYVRADWSVSGCDGRETDLIAVFEDLERFGKHFLFLIEDKKSASLSEGQPEGYHVRGKDYVANGYENNPVSGYKTVLVAPADYYDDKKSRFDMRFDYEDAREWIKKSPDIESNDKNEELKKLDFAIENPGYNKHPNDERTAFHFEYWRLAKKIAPDLNMDAPRVQAMGNWIYMSRNSIPLPHFSCTLWFFHKLHPNKKSNGSVELQFYAIKDLEGRDRIQKLHAKSGSNRFEIIPFKRSISIGVYVPRLDKQSNDFASQKERIIKGIEAARELHLWALENVNGYRQRLPAHKLRQ